MHTIKFQFVEKAAEEKVDLFSVLPTPVDLFARLRQKKALAQASAFFNDVCLRQMMLASPMMTATPNDVCLTAHWANIASLRPTGATSF